MNQDQVKEQLLKLEEPKEFFSVRFSGKSSKKVNGLYKPSEKEIIIHNKNMETDDQIMYTAIHEFAHHLHFSSQSAPNSSRSHTTEFWNIFHHLLIKAEELGIYHSIFSQNDEFVSLTKEINEQFIKKNGELMKDFGRFLLKAHELCLKYHTRFEDYVDRILKVDRSTAKTLVNIYKKDIDSNIGFDNMKTLSRLSDQQKIEDMTSALKENFSVDMVKTALKSPPPLNDKTHLMKEKQRIERSIANLNNKLQTIEEKLGTL